MNEALRIKGEKALHDAMMAFAYTEIANLFSAFTWFVRGAEEGKAFETLWSKREDIAYVASGKGYRGREAVKAWFVDRPAAMRQEKLPVMAALFPDQVKDSSEYLGAGDYEMHWLTTPFIRVANDLQTAKGAWWSPGIVSEVDTDAEIRPYIRTINYGCDFIFEDGWKIWHLREFAEFSFALENRSQFDMTNRETTVGAAAVLKRRQAAGAPASNAGRTAPGPYTKTRVPSMLPDVVAPYDTWDDSMSCIRDY